MSITQKFISKYTGNFCFYLASSTGHHLFEVERNSKKLNHLKIERAIEGICSEKFENERDFYLVSYGDNFLYRYWANTIEPDHVNTHPYYVFNIVNGIDGYYAIDKINNKLIKFSIFPFLLQWEYSLDNATGSNKNLIYRGGNNTLVYSDSDVITVFRDDLTHCTKLNSIRIDGTTFLNVVTSGQFNAEYAFATLSVAYGAELERSSSSSSSSTSSSSSSYSSSSSSESSSSSLSSSSASSGSSSSDSSSSSSSSSSSIDSSSSSSSFGSSSSSSLGSSSSSSYDDFVDYRNAVVPQMLAANDPPPYIISHYPNSAVNHNAWMAFDRDSNTMAQFVRTTSGFGEIRIYLGGESKIVNSYAIIATNKSVTYDNNPIRGWQLAGSNNATTWTTIDTRSNVQLNTSGDYPTLYFVIRNIGNVTAYKYYRITRVIAPGENANRSAWVNQIILSE